MKKKIAITIGDPAGIGPEIVVKALLLHPEIYETTIPIVFGHATIIRQILKISGLQAIIREIELTESFEQGDPHQIQAINLPGLNEIPEYGRVSGPAGILAFEYLKQAIDQALKGKVQAIVTAPINKEALKRGGIPYLDHTEILSKLTNSRNVMTLFVTKNLRIFFYSRHIPFNQISFQLNKDKIVQTFQRCHIYLEQIGIRTPRLALAALNPHAGEQGMFGREEIEILMPAVSEAQQLGLSVYGPIPADSVFHLAKEGQFDAVLCLYHDQGHIAAKTFDFYHTISLTMGLPFLRASVDHGTAMDLAGKNQANELSMVEAIKAAAYYSW